MIQSSLVKKITETKNFLSSQTSLKPQIGLVLGSGLGPFVDFLENKTVIPFSSIPGFSSTTVAGHSGALVYGTLKSDGGAVDVVVMQGRVHYYEGHELSEVVFPIRVLCSLGIKALILTNAAGGLNPSFRESDIMMITDHINLTGLNPLRGPNEATLGPRFPDMTEAYDRRLLEIFKSTAEKESLELKEGIYSWYLGPSYETPAEIRAFRVLGADATGMSTVPEVIAARHMGIPVAAISCITNLASGITSQKLTHEDVVQSAKKAVHKIFTLLKSALPQI